MTWNQKKKWVEPQEYYVLDTIYQMADVSNSNLPLCLGRFFPLMFWIPSLLSSYLCQTFPFDPHDSKEVDNVSFTNEAK